MMAKTTGPAFGFSAFSGQIMGWDGQRYQPLTIAHARDLFADLSADAQAGNGDPRHTAQAAIELGLAINERAAWLRETARPGVAR